MVRSPGFACLRLHQALAPRDRVSPRSPVVLASAVVLAGALGHQLSLVSRAAAGRVKKTAPLLIAAYERGDSVEAQRSAARSARVAARAAFREPEDAVDVMSNLGDEERVQAESAIEARLKKYASAMANAMLDGFDGRLPMPEVLLYLREVLDFRRMPWGDLDALNSWSHNSIKWIVGNKFPEFDATLVQSQALKVRLWLDEHRQEFLIDAPVYNDFGDLVKDQFKNELALCGEGSIYQKLFTKHAMLFPSGIQQYLCICDYSIAFIVTQCATERIGRNMTLTKPPERQSLGDENFKKLVWVSYNGPPIHEVDFSKYLPMWEREKHQLALFKSGGESKVLERKGGEHKHTILSNRVKID